MHSENGYGARMIAGMIAFKIKHYILCILIDKPFVLAFIQNHFSFVISEHLLKGNDPAN